MPRQFDTKRIYELPIMKHNIAAVKLIFSNALGEELSDEFLQKAIDHSTLLAKLIILDNIPVGCIYSHIEQKNKSGSVIPPTLVIDFICVLKSYQHHGVGKYVMNQLIERSKKELNVQFVNVHLRGSDESKEFFIKNGFVEKESEEYTFDNKTKMGMLMTKSL